MFRLPRPAFLLLALTAVLIQPLQAQSPADGRRPVEKPGIALVKSQAWSSAEQATVLEFSAYTNRSGYFEFKTARNPSQQIPSARVVKIVLFPDEVPELVTSEQRAALQKAIDDLAGVGAMNASAKRILEPYLGGLKADATKFDAGNIKESGVWKTKSGYYRQKAEQIAKALKEEMDAAPQISDYALEESALYRGLADLATVEPSLGPMVAGVKGDFEARKRGARRAVLLSEIKSPSLTMARAQEIVAELKNLQPSEDRETSAFLARWEAALASATEVKKRIEDTRAAFEVAVASMNEENPKFPSALVTQVMETDAVANTFKKNAPAALTIPADTSRAMATMVEIFPSAFAKIKDRQFFAAKDAVDPLAQQAMTIGPKSVGAVSALQQSINEAIGRFMHLRDEANRFLENNNTSEALKKLEEAYAVLPTEEMKAQIDSLRNPKKN